MIDKVLEQSGKLLSSRTILTGALPVAGLFGAILLMLMAGLPTRPPSITRAADTFAELSTSAWVTFVVAAFVGGMLLEPLSLPITRAFEGYWSRRFVIGWFRDQRIKTYRARRTALMNVANTAGGDDVKAQAAAWQLYHYFPGTDAVLPTQLGNVLRSAEQRPFKRYGLDAIVFWPRLYPLIPDRLAGIVDDARDQLDFAVRVTAVSLASAVATLLLLLPQWGYFAQTVGTDRLWPLLWLLIPWSAAVLAWLAYRGAVYAALQYGTAIQTAYDLHRFDLLKALHLELPSSTEEEKTANIQISMFFGQDVTKPLRYRHPDAGNGEGTDQGPVFLLNQGVIA